jgi:hypothetical protein
MVARTQAERLGENIVKTIKAVYGETFTVKSEGIWDKCS